MKLIIHTDGGARGNPGPAAIGVVIEELRSSEDAKSRSSEEGKNSDTSSLRHLVTSFGKRIGETTNNVAEYTAIIEAFKYIQEHRHLDTSTPRHFDFYLDSLLVVNQLKGLFKVKDARLRELLMAIRVLEGEVGGVITYTHVPREQNKEADFEVNKALNNPL